MKRKSSKFFAALISVIVAVSVLTVTVFAADTKGLSSGLKKYLSNPENTQFYFRIPRLLTMTPIGLFLYFQDAAKKMYIRNIRNT